MILFFLMAITRRGPFIRRLVQRYPSSRSAALFYSMITIPAHCRFIPITRRSAVRFVPLSVYGKRIRRLVFCRSAICPGRQSRGKKLQAWLWWPERLNQHFLQ